ncbi:uncharacterized protein [Paramormyrops kingsleyae]|uniref:uncharacterized protein n=1 Tax=Paramormyrops kingsleyae TaxID=1676925 RepID=UPI000CD661B2|nr:neurotoxin 3FTx-RI-like [Paramormyrops kingsleyae]
MKSLLAMLVLLTIVVHNKALKCHTCVAGNEDECNQQGTSSCPQCADACVTIMGPSTVVKSCSYKPFCDKAHHNTGGVKMECCFTDDCNGPHRSHSHGEESAAPSLGTRPVLLLLLLLLQLIVSKL